MENGEGKSGICTKASHGSFLYNVAFQGICLERALHQVEGVVIAFCEPKNSFIPTREPSPLMHPKFAEQFGDIIGWDATNRKYVLAHGMTGLDWEHYKHPLPEDVYDIYLRSWGNIDLIS